MDERQVEGRQASQAMRRRREVVTAIGAAVAAGMAQASSGTAHAANGEALIIGNTGAGQVGAQSATATTVLSATTGSGLLPTLQVGGAGVTEAIEAGSQNGRAIAAQSITNHGVSGATNAGPLSRMAGVHGGSIFSVGVFGESTGSGIGVSGESDSGDGLRGNSNSRHGVWGISQNAYGARGNSVAPAGTTILGGGLAAGVYGQSQYNAGVYGYTFGPVVANMPTYGAIGQSEGGFGAWGICSAPPGTIASPGGAGLQAVAGVLGTSTSNVGMYAISTGNYALVADANGPSTVGALVRKPGGQAAVFVGNVQVQGNLHVTGSIQNPAPPAGASAAATEGGGQRPVAPDGTDAWLEDVGEATLLGGRAEVRFDPAFAAALPTARYHVFLTEYEDHSALFVTRRTAQGFEVRAKGSPTASGTFSYRVVARRLDGAAPRRAGDGRPQAAPEPLHTPSVPATQGAPVLRVERDAAEPPTPRIPTGPPAPGQRPR